MLQEDDDDSDGIGFVLKFFSLKQFYSSLPSRFRLRWCLSDNRCDLHIAFYSKKTINGETIYVKDKMKGNVVIPVVRFGKLLSRLRQARQELDHLVDLEKQRRIYEVGILLFSIMITLFITSRSFAISEDST
jgi:hypothetical protein